MNKICANYHCMEEKFYEIKILFIDLKNTFKTVNHEILLSKLKSFGIKGLNLKLFEDYLSFRRQYVTIGEEKSGEIVWSTNQVR